MNAKDKQLLFICQITESSIAVLKCRVERKASASFIAFSSEPVSPGLDEKSLGQRFTEILFAAGFHNHPLVISLPTNSATCRFLKVPSVSATEIEKMLMLQASKFLPYPPDELVIGHQVITTDKDGYSNVNLIIAHNSLIGRIVAIARQCSPRSLNIVLSSYGSAQLLKYCSPKQDADCLLIVDILGTQAELIIQYHGKVLFNRFLKLNTGRPDWQGTFVQEVRKTLDLYGRETEKDPPEKILILDNGYQQGLWKKDLAEELGIPVEYVSYLDRFDISQELKTTLAHAPQSAASLLGLALLPIENSLDLLPADLKAANRKRSKKADILRTVVTVAIAIALGAIATQKHLQNKVEYLERLKNELKGVSPEAQKLEELDKRLTVLEDRAQKRMSLLDVLSEIVRTLPADTSLTNFVFEEDNQIVLHGQCPEFPSVLSFVSGLEKIDLLRTFSVKIRYATQKRIQDTAMVDFEIVCARER